MTANLYKDIIKKGLKQETFRECNMLWRIIQDMA